MEDLDKFLFDLGCAIALLITALVGCFMPLRIYTNSGRTLPYQVGIMFSAGVMVSASFCHLLADSLEVIEEKVPDFPLGEFLCATGFFAVLVIDQIADSHTEHSHRPAKVDEPLMAEEGEGSEATEQPIVSLHSAIILAIALLFHSVLEGLALGTEESLSSSIGIAIALLAHKGFAGYALATTLVDSKASRNIFWLVTWSFSLATPIGIMAGFAISEFSDDIVSSCLSSLAGGTFLYVALMELIPNELSMKGNKVAKIGAMLVGFGIMSLIARWA